MRGSPAFTVITIDGFMSIAVNNGDTNGELTFNGTVYATISDLENGSTKVSYTDGTFEIF